jgi:hypothetical protein
MPAATRNFSDKLACVIDAFARRSFSPFDIKVADVFGTFR